MNPPPTQIPADPDRINVYVCRKCGRFTTTIDIHKGVTPFMIGCRGYGVHSKAICDGMAQSKMYPKARPIPPHIPKPMFEWYTPDAEEYKTLLLDDPLRDHVDRGGLLLRPISKEVKR